MRRKVIKVMKKVSLFYRKLNRILKKLSKIKTRFYQLFSSIIKKLSLNTLLTIEFKC